MTNSITFFNRIYWKEIPWMNTHSSSSEEYMQNKPAIKPAIRNLRMYKPAMMNKPIKTRSMRTKPVRASFICCLCIQEIKKTFNTNTLRVIGNLNKLNENMSCLLKKPQMMRLKIRRTHKGTHQQSNSGEKGLSLSTIRVTTRETEPKELQKPANN